jgi:hypothetical protein
MLHPVVQASKYRKPAMETGHLPAGHDVRVFRVICGLQRLTCGFLE